MFKNLQLQEAAAADPALVGYEPVQWFVEELQRVYGASVMFFYDKSAKDVVAGVWSPHVEERAWKVGLGFSSVPMEKEGEGGGAVVAINKTGILNDIGRLGGDMIARIDVKGE